MRTAYANVCIVSGTREQIMLLFGANQAWQRDHKEIRVLLSDRVVLMSRTECAVIPLDEN